jgi:hypothetical protein
MRARAAGLAASAGSAASLCLLLLGCSGTPNASFELDVPSATAGKAAWYEVGVLSGACPSSSLLRGGIPTEGPVARLAFAASTVTPPGLGILPKQTYAIAAVARASDCSVIAAGCSTSSVSGGTVAVSLTAVSGAPEAACARGARCDEASCVPSPDAGADLGGGCSLALVGSGPLGDPLSQGTTLLSAPAIAATTTGFLVAYREFDPNAGAARLTTIAIDPGGGAAAPALTTLPGSCVASPEKDATALAFSGAEGTLGLSRPACPGSGDAGAAPGGVDLFSIDSAGTIAKSSFSGQAGLDITLAADHALAYTPAGLLLAYTNRSTQSAFAATVVGTALAASPPPIAFSAFGGLASQTAGFVVAADLGTGFFALGTAATDGGAAPGASASFTSKPSDAGNAATGSASTYPAKWVSAGGVGSRIIVASNGPSTANSVLWSAYDVGEAAPASTGTFAPASGGTVSFVDVALRQDHAFFAAEVDQTLSLFAFEKASTFPLQLREVPFASLPIIPVGALRDGLVAVAASDTRVAVVWGTGATLGSDDDVGGYAVFACTP